MVIEKSLFVKVVCQKSRLSGRKQPVDKVCDSANFAEPVWEEGSGECVGYDFFLCRCVTNLVQR